MARTRSAAAHAKVLDAALQLIAERGIEGASMDAIASVSGVSKATVYKHWENKDALCLDAIARLMEASPEFDSGDPRKDITDMLRYFLEARKSERWSKIWPRVVGYAAGNPAFGKAMSAVAMGPRRRVLARLLGQAMANGELRRQLDLDFSMDLLIGPVMHRRFSNQAIPPDLPERVVEVFWKLHRPSGKV